MIVIAAQAGLGFPNGPGAAASRVSCYARGLRAAGHDVVVLCLGTSEPSPPAVPVNREVSGLLDGIPFEYTCGTTIRPMRYWRRRWLRLRGLVGAALRIRRLAGAAGIEAVLLYSDSSLEAASLHFVARSVGAAYIVDLCELPYHGLCGMTLGRLRRSLYNRTFFRWFDGAIAISDSLRRHALTYGPSGLVVTSAPAMVDTDEFRPGGAASGSPVVMYCGMLNQQKDGVLSLLRAFAGLARNTTDARLSLVGDSPRGSRIRQFRASADRLGITDRVTFVGNVAQRETPTYLPQATVLVLARPRSPQADAGMPTKLAEYLASGVPVVVTRTGEIPTLLEDRVNAYLIPPDDEAALENALRYVLSHPEEARAVGHRGRELAVERLDYRVVGAHVADFVAGLGRASQFVGASE